MSGGLLFKMAPMEGHSATFSVLERAQGVEVL